MNRTEEYFKANSGKIVINGKEYTQEELSDILSTTKSKRRKQLLGQIYQQKARVKKKQALCERYEREMDQYGKDLKSVQRQLRLSELAEQRLEAALDIIWDMTNDEDGTEMHTRLEAIALKCKEMLRGITNEEAKNSRSEEDDVSSSS